MPYIQPEKRAALDSQIDDLLNELRGLESDDPMNNFEGNLNYVITKLLKGTYDFNSYRDINDAVGMLECCKLEVYRKLAAPYEDQKEFDNGSV